MLWVYGKSHKWHTPCSSYIWKSYCSLCVVCYRKSYWAACTNIVCFAWLCCYYFRAIRFKCAQQVVEVLQTPLFLHISNFFWTPSVPPQSTILNLSFSCPTRTHLNGIARNQSKLMSMSWLAFHIYPISHMGVWQSSTAPSYDFTMIPSWIRNQVWNVLLICSKTAFKCLPSASPFSLD